MTSKDKIKKIMISKKNKGKFINYCKSRGYNGVTMQCISDGKASSIARIRRRAIFAENARQWNKG